MFSVTQLDINFSHIYLNKLDMLKMFFSHSKLENNSWFEELFNFLVIIAAAKLQLSKKCAFLMPKFDSIWKKHFWTQRADRTFIFVYLGKINFQRAFSYQLCLLVKKGRIFKKNNQTARLFGSSEWFYLFWCSKLAQLRTI